MASTEAATLAPPPTRRAAPRELPALVADAVVCGYFRSVWVLTVTNAALIAARRAFGGDSSAAAVSKDLFLAALVSTGLHSYFAAPLMLSHLASGSRKAQARENGETPAAQRRRPQSTGARGRQGGVYGPVTPLILFVLHMVAVVGLLVQVLAPAEESRQGRIGSILADIGSFLSSVAFCIISDNFVIRLRVTYASMSGRVISSS
ncbi:hypothetical protein ACP70R_046176 [Stipagrostis hirtigluma subsp. patula]